MTTKNHPTASGQNYAGPVLCINLWIDRLASTADIPDVLRQIAQHFEDQGGHGSGIHFAGREIGSLYTAAWVEKEPPRTPSPN